MHTAAEPGPPGAGAGVRPRAPVGLLFAAGILAVAAVYFAAAKLGLKMAFRAEQVSAVWPPTGIALAVLLLFGRRFWPGVALGAFLVNATANEPPAVALGIATGNTLEALVGAGLLRRLGFANSFGRPRDVLAFAAVAAGATTVSATVGVTSLCLGGAQPWAAYGPMWGVWWLGDATGALLVAPLLLTGSDRPSGRRAAEAGALAAAAAAVAAVVFGGALDTAASHHPLEYTVFPLVIGAALRFGPPGAALVTFVTAAVAVWGTAGGRGPFAGGDAHENLVLLQAFLGVVAATALFLAAAIAERTTAERRRAADFAVTQVLAESAGLADAVPRILDAIRGHLGWDVGGFWAVDREAGAIRCVEFRPPQPACGAEFEAMTRGSAFGRGVGLPGRVWATGEPTWSPDVTRDPIFPRAAAAARAGLRGGFGFPIRLGTEVLGVIEFFSREIRPPDNDLLRMFATVGGQVGQFMDRRRAEAALREADRRKDEFLATLAHELRNPLAPIRNALEVLRLAGGGGAEARRARDVIDRQLRHLVRLVDDLLDVARITRGQVELRRGRVELAAAVERAVEASRPLIEAAGHELSVTLPEQPVWLDADPVRVTQVISNLLNNAAKYTKGPGRIRLLGGREGGEAVIRVRDDGIGIPAVVLPLVFEMFTQADPSPEGSQGGLGVGLALVKQFVELHGGSVRAASAGPGRGSEFEVRLPVAPDVREGPDAEAPAVERRPPAPCRILVVDDNRDSAESLAELLRLTGNDVRTAYDGPAALELARSYRPEVMLLDIGMPGMSGYEVARRVREQDGLRGVVLAALTGWGQDEDRRRSREGGFDHHLTKPADPAALEELLASLHPPASMTGNQG